MPNDGSAPAYAQGSPVSVHLPPESLRVLPDGPPPVWTGRPRRPRAPRPAPSWATRPRPSSCRPRIRPRAELAAPAGAVVNAHARSLPPHRPARPCRGRHRRRERHRRRLCRAAAAAGATVVVLDREVAVEGADAIRARCHRRGRDRRTRNLADPTAARPIARSRTRAEDAETGLTPARASKPVRRRGAAVQVALGGAPPAAVAIREVASPGGGCECRARAGSDLRVVLGGWFDACHRSAPPSDPRGLVVALRSSAGWHVCLASGEVAANDPWTVYWIGGVAGARSRRVIGDPRP